MPFQTYAGDRGQLNERLRKTLSNTGTRIYCMCCVDRLKPPTRDTEYCESFRTIVDSSDVKTLPLPARSPNLNAFAERWVKSVKDECLSKLILFGEKSLRRAIREYLTHFHTERNHQGKGNILLLPVSTKVENRIDGSIHCKERLGGLLKYYNREAA